MHSSNFEKVFCLDFQNTKKSFLKTALIIALIVPVILAEVLFKSEMAATGASLFISTVFIVVVIKFAVDIFKLYNRLLYNDSEYTEKVNAIKMPTVLLSKYLVTILWLLIFTIAFLMLYRLQIYFAGGFLGGGNYTVQMMNFINTFFGEGSLGVFSFISVFSQIVFMISIVFLSISLSHEQFFERYKTLAGIFMIAALWTAENFIASYIKRLIVKAMGGIEKVMAGELTSALAVLTAVEMAVLILLVIANGYFTVLLLRKNKKQKNLLI